MLVFARPIGLNITFQAVSAPGQVISAVQLEAFKKLSLIQLILYGKV